MLYLVHNRPSHTHAIQDGNIYYGWHTTIVDGLGTVWPHVRAFSQVYVAGTETTIKETIISSMNILLNTKAVKIMPITLTCNTLIYKYIKTWTNENVIKLNMY